MYFDLDGPCSGKNFKTNDTIEMKFIPRKWNSQSKMEGIVKNSKGEKMYEISGSWVDEIKVKNLTTG